MPKRKTKKKSTKKKTTARKRKKVTKKVTPRARRYRPRMRSRYPYLRLNPVVGRYPGDEEEPFDFIKRANYEVAEIATKYDQEIKWTIRESIGVGLGIDTSAVDVQELKPSAYADEDFEAISSEWNVDVEVPFAIAVVVFESSIDRRDIPTGMQIVEVLALPPSYSNYIVFTSSRTMVIPLNEAGVSEIINGEYKIHYEHKRRGVLR